MICNKVSVCGDVLKVDVLKKKRKILREMCDTLQKDADQLAEQAEGKS